VGVGSIGREVARLASVLGMKVVAVRKNFTAENGEEDSFTTKDTEEHRGKIG